METWQRGHSLDVLKSYAAPFREHHRPLVYGAFGMVKERDVAAALAEERIERVPPDGRVQGVAIFNFLGRSSFHLDYARRKIGLLGPCIYVSAFAACGVGAGLRLVKRLLSRIREEAKLGLLRGLPLYVEVFEEDEIARDVMREAGFRYLGTKIMAGSEIKGIYTNDEHAEIVPPCREESATLSVLVQNLASARALREIREELARAITGGLSWAQHYSSYNKRRSWTAFALRGYWDDPNRIEKPLEMSRAWKEEHASDLDKPAQWLSAARHFPATLRLLDDLPSLDLDRVRFMRLAPGGELTRHADITDREAGVCAGKIARLHIPIVTNSGVVFRAWDERGRCLVKNLPAGCLAYLDQRKPHAVRNSGSTDRIHLVVDCYVNRRLRAMIAGA